MESAIRDIKEETDCDVEITGIASLGNKILKEDIFVEIIFIAKLQNETIKINHEEILDVKWWNIDDVLNNMD